MMTTYMNFALTMPRILPTLCLSIGLSLSLANSLAQAHPGHETLPLENHSALHHLLEPYHAASSLALGLGLTIAIILTKRISGQRRSLSR
jgi:hypothetical protein